MAFIVKPKRSANEGTAQWAVRNNMVNTRNLKIKIFLKKLKYILTKKTVLVYFIKIIS